jgi:Putative Ig domain
MLNFKSWLLAISSAVVLAACGGGGGGSTTPTPVVGPCGAGFTMPTVSYPSTINATATVAIAAITPTLSAALPAACASTATYTATGLPAGLSINSTTGVITGTPTTSGSSAATISFNVPGYTSSSASSTANVAPAGCAGVGYTLPTPTYTSIAGTQNIAIAASNPAFATAIPAACAGALTYSATGLPAGLAINPSTGQITGTSTAVVNGNFAVTLASAPYANAVSTPTAFNIATPAPTPCLAAGATTPTVSYSPFAVTAGTGMNAQTPTLSAALPAGCTPTFSATGLPAGATISSSTGVVSGTMSTTAASGNMVVTLALPTYPNSGSGNVAYTVSPVVNLPSLAAPQAGSIASQTLTTAEGFWYYSFNASPTYVAADGTIASYGFFNDLYGTIAYPTSSTWSLSPGGFAIGSFGGATTSGSGTFIPKTALSGSFTSGTPDSLSGSNSSNLSYGIENAIAINGISDMAGTYQGGSGTSIIKFVIDSTGAISGSRGAGTATACTITGNLTLKNPGTQKNMFSITYTPSNASCGLQALPYTGLAVASVSNGTPSGTYKRMLKTLSRTAGNTSSLSLNLVRD